MARKLADPRLRISIGCPASYVYQCRYRWLCMRAPRRMRLRVLARTALPGHTGSQFRSLPGWRTGAAVPLLTCRSPASRQTLSWRTMPRQCPWLRARMRRRGAGARSGTTPEPNRSTEVTHGNKRARLQAYRSHNPCRRLAPKLTQPMRCAIPSRARILRRSMQRRQAICEGC